MFPNNTDIYLNEFEKFDKLEDGFKSSAKDLQFNTAKLM